MGMKELREGTLVPTGWQRVPVQSARSHWPLILAGNIVSPGL